MRFKLLVKILITAFNNGCTEGQYRKIVRCLRDYNADRDSQTQEKNILEREGWPSTYHPCDHMENIRWGLCFTPEKNFALQALLEDYKLCLMKNEENCFSRSLICIPKG